MILGLGTDITEIARVKSSLERFGDSFLNRILRPEEVTYCRTQKDIALPVAARFAAKEAISKAFGTGIGAQLGWQDIEIRRRPSGEPYVVLYGGGLKLIEERKGKQVLVSLSHTVNYATAVAILESA